jgi:hypothetical protein
MAMVYSNRFPQWNKVLVAVEKRTRRKVLHWGGFEGAIEELKALTSCNGWGFQENEEGGYGEDVNEVGEDSSRGDSGVGIGEINGADVDGAGGGGRVGHWDTSENSHNV